AAVAAAVTESREAIGYVGLNHLTPGVKPLALEGPEGKRVAPVAEQVRQGTYPLSRSLLLYVNLLPGAALEGRARALLELILCPEGQRDRKSTRLNSSHVSISYAVFCLKKKQI